MINVFDWPSQQDSFSIKHRSNLASENGILTKHLASDKIYIHFMIRHNQSNFEKQIFKRFKKQVQQ